MPSFPTNKYRNGFRSHFGISNETDKLTCLQGGERAGYSCSTLNLDGVDYVVGSTCVADVERGTRSGRVQISIVITSVRLPGSRSGRLYNGLNGGARFLEREWRKRFANIEMRRLQTIRCTWQRNTRPVLSHIMMRSIHPVYVKYMIPRLCYIWPVNASPKMSGPWPLSAHGTPLLTDGVWRKSSVKPCVPTALLL